MNAPFVPSPYGGKHVNRPMADSNRRKQRQRRLSTAINRRVVDRRSTCWLPPLVTPKQCVIAVLCSFAVVQALSSAGIINGGFESGEMTPWFHRDNEPGNPFTWSVTSAESHSGSFSATVYGNEEIRQNFEPIPTGQISDLSFWVRHTTAPCLMFIAVYYAEGDYDWRQPIVATTEWEQYDVTSWLAPGRELTGFSIYGFSLNHTYLDDVVLVPEPRTIKLMVLTGLAVAAALRMARIQWSRTNDQ